ncbi:MAG: 50S ribosomal protein L4 [Chloroflexi bacterium]|nr:50S ribosomal protein L4 [Chloroflexota bacterium]
MQRNIVDMAGNVLRPIELDDRVFGITPNQAVVHQAVVAQQANARQGTHDTKTRAEVAGGGKKPYRQKGTGNARQGSTRAPHYRTGGVVFGPHPRDHGLAMPRKMRRLALRSVLSARAAEEALIVVEDFLLDAPRTKQLLSALARLELGEQTLIVLGERSEPVLRAARNLATVHVVTPNGLNLLDLLRLPRLVLDTAAVETLTRTLTSDLPPAASSDDGGRAPARSAAVGSSSGAVRPAAETEAGAAGSRRAASEPIASGVAGEPSPAMASEVAAVPAPAEEPPRRADTAGESALPPSPTVDELALPPEEEFAPETGAPIEAVDVDEPINPPATEEGSR